MESSPNDEDHIASISPNNELQSPNRSYFRYILLVSILTVTLAVIMIVYMFNQTNSQIKLKKTPVVPSPTEIKTSWNEYVDENVQFHLRYPTNWNAHDPYVGSYPEKTWIVNFSPRENTGALIQIVTRPIDSAYHNGESWAGNSLEGDYQKVKDTNYVDNLQAIRFEDSIGNVSTFFNTNDTLYSITLFKGSIHDGYGGNDSDYQVERMIYENLLKSFKVGIKPPIIPTLIPVTRVNQ